MSTLQTQAIWELCREGYPLVADQAAARWDQGHTFRLSDETQISRPVATLIEQCNWIIANAVEAQYR